MINEIETMENARFSLDEDNLPFLQLEVNGRYCEVYREKALRIDGQVAQMAPWKSWKDFSVIVDISDEPGVVQNKVLRSYTSNPVYVDLVWRFVSAVDGGTFAPGAVPIQP